MYIKRKLDDNLTVFKNLRDNYKNDRGFKHRYLVTLGIGGNLGDVRRRFQKVYMTLKKEKRVSLLKTSLILKNPPFGFKDQDDFFNSIVLLKTSMQPGRFLDYLMRLEKRFARKRSFANAPRTLDLDIIFFDDRVIDTPRLQVPHKYWQQRQSVLIPLMDIYK